MCQRKSTIDPRQQRYWYTACAKCYKFIHAEVDWEIKCPSCKTDTQVEAELEVFPLINFMHITSID